MTDQTRWGIDQVQVKNKAIKYQKDLVSNAMAHDYVYGSQIKQGVIMVCTPDLYYQEFKTEGADLRTWKHKALKRINMYNELMHDEKERTTPMKAEDFDDKKR